MEEGEYKLGKFAQEIEKGIFDSEILRNHLTIDVKTPESYKQEYRIVYRNKREKITEGSEDNEEEQEKKNSLNCIRLTHRRKKAQRNLSVFDREGKKLTIVPSDLVQDALCKICRFYLSIAKNLNNGGQFLDDYIKNIDFESIFAYNSDPKLVNEVCTDFERFETAFDSKPALDYFRRTYALVKTYEYFYIPIVKLETPLKPRDCMFIGYSVENLKDELRNWSLYTLGFLTISLPLELESTASNHIRFLTPPGMVFRHANISNIKDPALSEKYSNLDNFLDDDMIYFHIPKKDAKKLEEEQEGIVEEKEIRINVGLGISRKFPWRHSLIRILIFLMYVAVFIPLISFLFPCEQFEFSFGFPIVTISIFVILGILVSLAVYAIDKRFVHDYLSAQIVIILIIFTIENFLLFKHENISLWVHKIFSLFDSFICNISFVV